MWWSWNCRVARFQPPAAPMPPYPPHPPGRPRPPPGPAAPCRRPAPPAAAGLTGSAAGRAGLASRAARIAGGCGRATMGGVPLPLRVLSLSLSLSLSLPLSLSRSLSIAPPLRPPARPRLTPATPPAAVCDGGSPGGRGGPASRVAWRRRRTWGGRGGLRDSDTEATSLHLDHFVSRLIHSLEEEDLGRFIAGPSPCAESSSWDRHHLANASMRRG